MSSVNPTNLIVQKALAAESRQALRFANDFPSELTIGQIIKGKVLRSYQEGRYAVEFGGQEKVVDSAIPLKKGEILYGRVVGLDEQVTLQRIHSEPPANNAQQASPNALYSALGSGVAGKLEAFLAQHNITLPPNVKTLLQSLMKAASKPDLMLTSALVLQKIGLQQNPELLRAVYRVLSEQNSRIEPAKINTAALNIGQNTETNQQAISQLMAALSSKATVGDRAGSDNLDSADADVEQLDNDSADKLFAKAVGEDGATDSQEKQEQQLGRFVLNTQTDGSVAHRLLAFPVWLGDRLVEVEMALFSQRERQGQAKGDIQYQRLVFSLDSEVLGHMEISVGLANRNLKIDIASDNEEATQWLAHYMPELKASLADADWQIDELSYRTHFTDAENNVLASVVNHYVSQDSLSRLL